MSTPDALNSTVVPASPTMMLEELKLVLEERQFVMSRYLQAITLYLVVASFAVTRIADADTLSIQTIGVVVVTAFNVLSIVGAWYFRLMAEQARRREYILAAALNFEPRRSHVWGFWMGVGLVMIIEGAAVALRIVAPAPTT